MSRLASEMKYGAQRGVEENGLKLKLCEEASARLTRSAPRTNIRLDYQPYFAI